MSPKTGVQSAGSIKCRYCGRCVEEKCGCESGKGEDTVVQHANVCSCGGGRTWDGMEVHSTKCKRLSHNATEVADSADPSGESVTGGQGAAANAPDLYEWEDGRMFVNGEYRAVLESKTGDDGICQHITALCNQAAQNV